MTILAPTLIKHLLEMSKSSWAAKYEHQEVLRASAGEIATLQSALADLIEQIDTLDDVTMSRDVEPYKAQASWDEALRRARFASAKEAK